MALALRGEKQAAVEATDQNWHAKEKEIEPVFLCITLEGLSPQKRIVILTAGILLFYICYFMITVRISKALNLRLILDLRSL